MCKVSTLAALPYEILVLINEHLDNNDRYQCCLVNRSLNEFYRNYIFHSLSFNSAENVIISCRRLALEPLLFWKITTLSINVPFSKQCPYSSFLKFCQNLKVLIIGERFWETLEFNGGVDNDDNLANGDDVDMQVDLDSYPVIPTLLELDVDCANIYGIEDLMALFIKCTYIKRLTLRQLFVMTTPSDLEQVHAVCPDLETLTLDHKNAFQAPLPLAIPLRLEPLDSTSPNMKHLSIFHGGLWDEFIPWLYYIADKYPRLRSLDISFLPTWRNNFGQTDVVSVAPLETAVRVLVNSCHLLNSVRFVEVWWASSFFRYHLNKYYHQQPGATSLRQVSVVANLVGSKIANTIFNLISVGVLPTIKSLDLTLHTECMATPPKYMFQSFRDARMLTNLRLSTPLNRKNALSLLWFLEFCPVLCSLVLDDSSIDVHLDDDDRWMSKRKRQETLSTHHLKRFTLTTCLFTNDIFDYLEQTCPDLIQLSLTTCLLHRSTSLRLWFPRHVFRSIHLNHVRVASSSNFALPVSTPISATRIGNPETWIGEKRPVEFITIQRHHTRSTAPTYRLGPCYVPNQHIFPTRSMSRQLLASGGPYQLKMQTFKVTSMTFGNQPRPSNTNQNYTGLGATDNSRLTKVMGFLSFLPLEFINTIKCMNARELEYYDKLGCLFLPRDSDTLSSPSMSGSKRFAETITEHTKRQKLQESTLVNQSHDQLRHQKDSENGNRMGSASQQQQQRQQGSGDFTIGAHLLVNVYGVTELQVNGKWMVL